MLKRVVRVCIDNAGIVVFMNVLLVGLAIYWTPRTAVDVFPELNAPQVVVMTEAAGLAADEVETFVTFPVETSVNGLPGVRRVRSASAIGLSIVWVEFDWGTDIYKARYLVSERLAVARESLPASAHSELAPVSSITGEIMLLSVTSPQGSVSDLDLRAYAEYDLRNRLLAVPGVSQVVAIGGELPEIQINVRQDLLMLYGMTIQEVVVAAGTAHSTEGAGYLLNVEGMELPLRQTGSVRGLDDIKDTLVRYQDGTPITIGQVADVAFAGALKRGTGSEGGRPAVVLSISKSPGANTLALTRMLDEALDQADLAVADGISINRHVMRQADFIQLSLRNVLAVARDAVIIVVITLIAFLLNVRATLITLTAIPLSLAMALLFMIGLGQSINVMTLGGLAVAIGVIVDDAIIGVENVIRRLRQNAMLPQSERRSRLDVMQDAIVEITSSIVFATIIIVMVFLPLLFLQGLEGRFFMPLGMMYITSIMASLVVALTLTPALCRLLLRRDHARAHGESILVRWLKRAYEPTLRVVLRWRKATVVIALVLSALSLLAASTFGTSFLPTFNEGTFTVFLMAPPGTSLVESDRLGRGVERRLLEIEGVRSVVRRTGRAERDEHAEPVSSSEIEVAIFPGFARDVVRARIDEVIKAVPGITTTIGQPIEHRLSHVLSGTPAAIAINVYGPDLEVLRQIAKEIQTALESTPGARDIAANREVMIQTVPIEFRRGDLSRWGLSRANAASQVKSAIFGEVVAQINDGLRIHDLVVRLAPDQRETIEQVKNLILIGENKVLMRLREVADIGREEASNLIARENGRRKAVISCNVAEGHNLGHLIAQVQVKVDEIVARHSYSVTYGGQFEAQQSAARTIYVMGGGVALFMFLLLHIACGSVRAALLVMVNLPLALIGGIAAIYVTESPSLVSNTLALVGIGDGPGGEGYRPPVMSIASMVGFVTLFGIAVRNGILLVNHFQHLLQEEGKSLEAAIVQGSLERLVPILMTAICAALGLLPLALAAGEPGSELLAPLAIVVLGGLLTSTLLNLVVVPAGYSLIFAPRRAALGKPHLADRDDGEKREADAHQDARESLGQSELGRDVEDQPGRSDVERDPGESAEQDRDPRP